MGVYGYKCDGCGTILQGDDVTVAPNGDQYPSRKLTSSISPMDLRNHDLCGGCFGKCEELLARIKQEKAS